MKLTAEPEQVTTTPRTNKSVPAGINMPVSSSSEHFAGMNSVTRNPSTLLSDRADVSFFRVGREHYNTPKI